MKLMRLALAALALICCVEAHAATLGTTTTAGGNWPTVVAPDINDDWSKIYGTPVLTIGNQTTWTNERGLAVAGCVSGTDGGAGSSYTIGLTTACIDAALLGPDSVSASELDEVGVEAGLEAVLDLQDLQGAVTAGQLTAIDTSAEIRSLLTDEIGTGVLVFLGTPADDQVPVGDSASATTWRALPDSDGATQKLQYDVSTNSFSAGTDDDVPEVGDFAALVGGAGVDNNSGTIDLDLTELSTATLGAGSFTALIFDAGATDPTFTFGSNSTTVTNSATFSLGTSAAFTTGSIELGAASDTTIARSGAGAVTVEGTAVILSGASPSFGTVTTTGNIELGNASDTTLSRASAGVLAVEGVSIPNNNRAINAGTGLTGGGNFSADRTVALDFSDAGASPALGADECRFTSNATTGGYIVCEGDTADTIESRIAFTDPATSDRVMTIPNADSNPVQPSACGGSDKVTGISSAGVISCGPDAGAGGGISNVVEDLTPQLGGSLDTNGFGIEFGTANTDTTVVRSGAGTLTVEGVGIVRGATGGTDNSILRADGTGGTLVQNSALIIADTSGAISGAASGFSIEFFGASGTDSTLTAPSAGDLNIEGNRIYRAGGTNVAIADGGCNADDAATCFGNIKQAASDTATGVVELATTAEAAAQTDTARAVTPAGLAFKPESFCMAASDETSNLTTGTNKVRFRIPYAFTVTDVRGSLSTVATGASLLTVDVNEAGTTILSTKLTFDASESTTTTAATARVISDTALANDAEIGVDIDQIGNTTPGQGLKVCIIGHQ